MIQGVYFKKYEQGNYFETDGTTFIDSLYLPVISEDAFPRFNIQTEEVAKILQYKAGDFILTVLWDTPYRSTINNSIYEFFNGGIRDYKFMVIVFFGTVPSPTVNFTGFFTNEKINNFYTSRRMDIKVKPAQDEVQEVFGKSMVGLLDQDRSLDNWLEYSLYPGSIRDKYLTTTKSFASYKVLVGNNTVEMQRAFQNAGSWINTITSWQQFMELMQGTGLMFKVKLQSVSNVNFNYPKFNIHIFNLTGMTAAPNPVLLDDPQETLIFNNKKWLYIEYRHWDWSTYDSGNGTYDSWSDGIISNGVTTYSTNTRRPQGVVNPNFPVNYPAFVRRKGAYYKGYWGSGGLQTLDVDKLELWQSIGNIPDTWSIEKDLNIIDLPKYINGYYAGYDPLGFPVVLTSNQRHATITNQLAATNYNFSPVQNYAMTQYQRYIGTLKRQKLVKVLWDENHYYDVFQTVTLAEPDEDRRVVNRNYYISRIENLQIQGIGDSPPSCDLTLIEI